MGSVGCMRDLCKIVDSAFLDWGGRWDPGSMPLGEALGRILHDR